MIVVLAWVDGFCNDTSIVGIADSLEEACENFQSEYNEHETRFQEITPDTEQWFEFSWCAGKPLFDKKKRGKQNGKRTKRSL